MTLNSIPVVGYNVLQDTCILRLKADSMDAAKAAISSNMVLKDDIGNDFLQLSGYGTIASIVLTPDSSIYELHLARDATGKERIDALEAENKELQAKLAAAIQSNQMLEDCIVEMAGVVYA